MAALTMTMSRYEAFGSINNTELNNIPDSNLQW